ncbi:N-acetylmuramoyl-L-alanine amidase [Methanobrevibacter smithii]|jgi:N-acetylmuramoyl-L-alanine amidase|uniref:N-acetylmuramoyl-L-alanine amidase n=1 Tax=Methanobrevibacter smithii TaxID=2173 RepID=UPI0037DC5FEE
MKKLVIILDCAHGADVKGKCSPDGTHREYKWSRLICGKLRDKLESLGYRVEYTNKTENEIGLSQRKNIANNIKINSDQVKFLISLHNNAAGNGSNWTNATGFEIFTSKGQTLSDKFAQVIMSNLQKDFPESNGFKHRVDLTDGDLDKEENFTVLMGNYYGILLEWLFQDNKEDVKLLNDEIINNKLIDSLIKSINYINDNFSNL